MFWSYRTITGNALFGQSHLCHPFIYGSSASPLLSRTPITKYIYRRVKLILAPQHSGFVRAIIGFLVETRNPLFYTREKFPRPGEPPAQFFYHIIRPERPLTTVLVKSLKLHFLPGVSR
jgi:hypothetical protein